MKDKKPAFSRCKKFGVFIVDGEGLAVRCFDERKKAFNWIGKHWPELKPAEAQTRVRTFGAYWQVRRFFDEQFRALLRQQPVRERAGGRGLLHRLSARDVPSHRVGADRADAPLHRGLTIGKRLEK